MHATPIRPEASAGSLMVARATCLAAVWLVIGCGGASKQADDPATESSAPDAAGAAEQERGAETEQDPEAVFAAAEKQLEGLFAGREKAGATVGPASPSPSLPSPNQGSTAKPMNEDEGEEISAVEREKRCTIACRALSSMQRSADRVCEMTSEGDSRCEQLRQRVERARSTVYASCPACQAARR